MNKRNLINLFIFLVIISFPYFIYIPVLLIFILFFDFYYEGIFFGFLIDIAYSPFSNANLSFNYPFALATTLIIILLLPVREQLTWSHV